MRKMLFALTAAALLVTAAFSVPASACEPGNPSGSANATSCR
jgi:hypothetical protein